MPPKKAVKKTAKKKVAPKMKTETATDEANVKPTPQGEGIIDIVSIEEEKPIDMENIEKIEGPADPRWTDYVLNSLEEDEKQDKYPKTDGLRRLVHKFIGPIVGFDVNVLSCPQGGGNPESNSATVVTTITVACRATGQMMTYSSVGDANSLSCPPPFDKFLSPIAETRAEGRCYRKILGLKNIVTADELDRSGSTTPNMNPDGASDSQITLIERMCRDQNVNIEALVKTVTRKKLSNVRAYKGDELREVLDKLHTAQNEDKQFPEQYVGYDPAWRESFG